jgi:hypothetical protein
MRDVSEGATVYGLFGGLIIEAAWKQIGLPVECHSATEFYVQSSP